jgi:hypothetical protein
MRGLAALCCIAAASLRAQQPAPPAPDSARAESARGAVAPTLEQQKFLGGLRTATRGLAQLKDGLNRVTRTQATGDTASQRKAGRFLALVCGSARAFMRRGRPAMKPAAYTDSIRPTARRLVVQLDSVIAYTASCEQNATAAPGPTAADLTKRMKTYDAALRDFRVAVGLPVKDDNPKASKHR